MLIFKNMFILVLSVGLFACACSGDKLDQTINVDLRDQLIGTTHFEILNVTNLYYVINVVNIPNEVDFFIIQVHTLNENVTLATAQGQSYINGTNIGLVKLTFGSTKKSFQLFRHEDFIDTTLSILIAVSVYTKNDPIPGGCNDSFETEFAPYQRITYTEEIVTVRSQPPSYLTPLCNKTGIVTDMYYMYLKESENIIEYFSGIQKMLNINDIKLYGTKVPDGLAPNKFDLMYNNYKGIGRIFAVISTSDNGCSSYVPAATFGCVTDKSDENYIGPGGIHWKLVVALTLIFGIFMCFCGHRFFKTTIFLNTATLVVFVVMIITSLDEEFTSEGKSIYSLVVGVLIGALWVFLWWRLGIPVLAVLPTFLLTGVLIASVVFYTQHGNFNILFADRITFWVTFGTILLTCQLPLLYLKPMAHIIALNLLASYAVVVALNYYIEGNLYYIIINTYRRIAVYKFEEAVIDPPYQFADISATILWAVLLITGIYLQYKNSLGRPPFPPHRRSSIERGSNEERSSLINRETPPPIYTEAVAFLGDGGRGPSAPTVCFFTALTF